MIELSADLEAQLPKTIQDIRAYVRSQSRIDENSEIAQRDTGGAFNPPPHLS